jgi:hypothetical protein
METPFLIAPAVVEQGCDAKTRTLEPFLPYSPRVSERGHESARNRGGVPSCIRGELLMHINELQGPRQFHFASGEEFQSR